MILLVRHGETEWNVQRRLQGRSDSPLTERGRKQAQAVGSLLRDLAAREGGDWRLIASPLPRARATAETIAGATALAMEIDDRLMELHCGDWEGRPFDELIADASGETVQLSRGRLFGRPGGETYDEVHARVSAFLADLPPEPERRVIVVSHGVTSRVLRAAYAGLTEDEVADLEVPHGSVFRLTEGQIDRFDCEPVD